MTEEGGKPQKRSIKIAGHATSLTLEDAFWRELQRLAKAEKVTVAALIRRIDESRTGNLSSAIRVYVLKAVKEKG